MTAGIGAIVGSALGLGSAPGLNACAAMTASAAIEAETTAAVPARASPIRAPPEAPWVSTAPNERHAEAKPPVIGCLSLLVGTTGRGMSVGRGAEGVEPVDNSVTDRARGVARDVHQF
jgi:hypothetical protein